MKSILVMGNVIISGFAAIFVSWFFAEGAIGDADALTPEYFLILLIWFIGALLTWKFNFKNNVESTSYYKIILSNLLLWLTIPIGLLLSVQFI